MLTRFTCLSDIHGHLPDNLNPTDFLLISGDICPTIDHSISFQRCWLNTNFKNWIRNITYEKNLVSKAIICIAGNHDFVFEKLDYNETFFANYKHPMLTEKKFYYLQDNGIELEGTKFWGSPWQRRFHDWAFNADEHELEAMYAKIPDDTDIILSHGPPYMYGDKVWKIVDEEKFPVTEHLGSPALTTRINTIKPKLVVYGHIHSGYGVEKLGETYMVNASYVNEQYKPVHKPIELEIAVG